MSQFSVRNSLSLYCFVKQQQPIPTGFEQLHQSILFRQAKAKQRMQDAALLGLGLGLGFGGFSMY